MYQEYITLPPILIRKSLITRLSVIILRGFREKTSMLTFDTSSFLFYPQKGYHESSFMPVWQEEDYHPFKSAGADHINASVLQSTGLDFSLSFLR